MRLYRITLERYLENYNGLGGSYRDGARWNRAEQPVLYFALLASTALLEMANYLPSPRLIPGHYRLGIYDVPDTAAFYRLPDDKLPSDWAAFPYPSSTQTIGGDWLDEGNELGLLVPSSAVPEGLELIAVINPRHPACASIQLEKSTAELFNKRTFTGI